MNIENLKVGLQVRIEVPSSRKTKRYLIVRIVGLVLADPVEDTKVRFTSVAPKDVIYQNTWLYWDAFLERNPVIVADNPAARLGYLLYS